MGFCRGYSFNTGDLTTCGDVLLNYLEAYESVPWDDLRYMFGEVGVPIACGVSSSCENSPSFATESLAECARDDLA